MSEIRELSFCELRSKDIVSISDGRKLGRIVDLVFSSNGRVQGIVAPYGRRFLFFRSQEVYIPYSNIKTIGEDIILVEIAPELNQRHFDTGNHHRYEAAPSGENRQPPPLPPKPQNEPQLNCDGRCDKCMLFDCESRWRKRNAVYVDNAPYN